MTEAELTILSLVAEGARYGHEIQQIIDERGLREWLTVGFSSIYYILNKLEEQQLVSSELRSQGRNPARKVYTITDAGHGVLQTAISDLLRQPRAIGSGFELGLANLYALKPRQVYKVLSDHKTDLTQRLALIETSWQRYQQEDDRTPDHIWALYTHSIALMRAELQWMTTFLTDWAKRYPAVERPTTEATQTPANPHSQETQLHRRVPPDDPAKMIQRLKRPRKPE